MPARWDGLDGAYLERVYAGVLGKITGVYLGRPVEGWSREHIVEVFGEVDRFVADDLGLPLVVTDDDIAGTFTFLRALPDHGYPDALTPAQVGRTWLDRLVEGSSVLWWGGRGVSTEHTAYLNLAAGTPAPDSGSAARNGVVAAEQIGAQIFVDGWSMVCPGDPAGAVALAGAAARVSHDGAAVEAARLVAAMEAVAFDTPDPGRIIESGLAFVTADGPVARLARSLLSSRGDAADWRAARTALDREWGYHRYAGACPVLPNLGVVLLALLWGGLDLQRSLMIAVTCGWDTDCNAGTVGCLVALARGLDAFDGGPDWRSPVADRILVSSSDGGGAHTDAVRAARGIVDIARARRGLPRLRAAGAPRYDFALPGSVQGFRSPDRGTSVENIAVRAGPGGPDGRALLVRGSGPTAQVRTDVFITGEEVGAAGYSLLASPALYPGHLLSATVTAPADTAVSVVLQVWGGDDALHEVASPVRAVTGRATVDFRVPDLRGFPVATVGVRATRPDGVAEFVLHDLGWTGPVSATLAPAPGQAPSGATRWREAWLHALDHPAPEPFGDTDPGFTLTQDRGRGLVSTGCDDWTDLRLRAVLRSDGVGACGIAVRVAGLRRHLALLVDREGAARLVGRWYDTESVLASVPAAARWTAGRLRVELVMEVVGDRLRGWVDGTLVADLAEDAPEAEPAGPGAPAPATVVRPAAGAVAIVVEEGTVTVESVEVGPAGGPRAG